MRQLLLALPILSLAACMVGPDYQPPDFKAPAAFQAAEPPGATATDLTRWWTHFNDVALTDRVSQALSSGPEIKAAEARLRAARALAQAARGGLWPVADVQGSYLLTTDQAQPGPLLSNPVTSIPVDVPAVRWDVDLFGGTRRSIEASEAQVMSANWRFFAVRVALAAETARQEILARGLAERVRIAQLNVVAQADTLRLAESRYKAGLSTEAPVAQARAQWAALKAVVPVLEEAKAGAEHRLAVLTGATPGTLKVGDAAVPMAPVPPAGLPIEVLRRRPDVAMAEAALHEATANIGIEKAELYPRLSFNAAVHASVSSPDDLLHGASYDFSAGPSVRWRLFDRARITYRVRAAGANAEAALYDFDGVVLRAIEEVENALTALARGAERVRLLTEARADAERSVEVARTLYTQGLGDFTSVLLEQQRLFAVRNDLAEATTRQALNVVGLYEALGAGWEMPEAPGGGQPARLAAPPSTGNGAPMKGDPAVKADEPPAPLPAEAKP